MLEVFSDVPASGANAVAATPSEDARRPSVTSAVYSRNICQKCFGKKGLTEGRRTLRNTTRACNRTGAISSNAPCSPTSCHTNRTATLCNCAGRPGEDSRLERKCNYQDKSDHMLPATHLCFNTSLIRPTPIGQDARRHSTTVQPKGHNRYICVCGCRVGRDDSGSGAPRNQGASEERVMGFFFRKQGGGWGDGCNFKVCDYAAMARCMRSVL